MSTLIITFFAMAIFISIMAVGVIFGREPLKGSCGGLNKVGIDGKCEICGKEPDSCETADSGTTKKATTNRATALAYDPLKKPESD